jgi:GTP-binding protein
VVTFDDQELVVADIPGLIEGASEGRGLGHQFLRHIERARVLVVLVDLGEPEGRSPAEQEQVLVEELRRHRPELAARPRLVVGSKADLLADFEGKTPAELAAAAAGGTTPAGEDLPPGVGPELCFSAYTGFGVREVVARMAQLVAADRAAQPHPVRWVEHRPAPEGVRVERDLDGGWLVLGRPARRAVALSDLTNVEALSYAQGRLKRLGVDRALARAGARDGDKVRIGDFEFDYEQD